MQYDAFIFDLDGTLIDTQAVDFAIHRDLLADLGYDLSQNTYAGAFGKTRRQMIEAFLQYTQEPDAVDEYAAHYAPLLERALRGRHDILVEHADAFCHELYLRGIPLAIATSSPRSVLAHISAIERILPLFAVTITADDVTNHKPLPEAFLKAADALGATRPFIFEDSLAGSLAAQRANIPFATHVHAANHSALRVAQTMTHFQFAFNTYADPRIEQLLD